MTQQDRKDWQKRCVDIGFTYWRASDAHGVTCTEEQAAQLLAELLGVEVQITDEPLPKDAPIPSLAELRELLTPNVCVQRLP